MNGCTTYPYVWLHKIIPVHPNRLHVFLCDLSCDGKYLSATVVQKYLKKKAFQPYLKIIFFKLNIVIVEKNKTRSREHHIGTVIFHA